MRRPRFIAEHARNARGMLGRVIAFIMARETRSQNLRAMDSLGIDRSDQILDLGCGHGHSLTELAARAATGRVVGVDPSELMVEIAALMAYTVGGAYAEGQDQRKGRIAPGFAADIAVLSQDVLTIPPPQLPATTNLLTLVDGEVIFEDAVFASAK